MADPSEVFFGYPSRPETAREALAAAAADLDRVSGISVTTWESLVVAGQIVIDKILGAIADADVSVFDVTTLNENVLFEVGFAIGAERPLWLVRDTSDEVAARRWNQIELIDGIGYESFVNSEEIIGPFMKARPDLEHDPVFQDIEALGEGRSGVASLFFAQGLHATNADRELVRLVEQERNAGIKVTVADASESAVEPLGWYAQQCAEADVVLLHLSAARRQMAKTHNSRCGLIAGIARGLGRPVLMLAEQEYRSPFDYRDLLYRYKNSRDCRDRTSRWLGRQLKDAHEELDKRARYAVDRRKSSKLASLRLGEHIAENESGSLASYFVDTPLYQAVLRGGVRLLVGRKGTGKTATLLRATEEFISDRRVVACTVQPSSYDLTGFERVMAEIGQNVDNREVVIESLWKYLLYSQMALDLLTEMRSKPAGISPGSPAWELDQYLRGPGDVFARDFGVRIDTALESLQELDLGHDLAADRKGLTNALHDEIIAEVRDLVARCLTRHDRVAILVDNLDASWDPKQELTGATDLLLGLIGASRKIARELERRVPGPRDPIEISVAVFLRSDIFERLRERAPEPDKIPAERIEWADEDTLLHVVGERYVSATDDPAARPQELWERYFTGEVDGRTASSYIVRRVVPRPRDIVFWCNAALSVARQRGHPQVTSDDIEESEAVYSRHAVDALQVELGSLTKDPEAIVYGFLGLSDRLTEREIHGVLRDAGIPEDELERVGDALLGFTFLGVEHPSAGAQFASDLHQVRRLKALARNARRRGGEPTYIVHPAFHRFLDIGPTDPAQQTLA